MSWNDDYENVLESIRQNSLMMKKYHTKNYISLKAQLKYYKIPVIVISALNSVSSVGLERYIKQQYISGITCILALLCGIIGSIELYLGIQSGMENELVSSKDYYVLSTDIYKTLSLNREHRGGTGKDMLDDYYSRYIKITDNSNIIRRKYKDALFEVPQLTENPHLRSLTIGSFTQSTPDGSNQELSSNSSGENII